jgi:hypothetical protein
VKYQRIYKLIVGVMLIVPALSLRKYHGWVLWQVVGDKLHLAVRVIDINYYFIFSGSAAHRGQWPRITRSLDHTQRRATVGRTPLDE